MPHPPESIPGIGRMEDFKAIRKTLGAFDRMMLELEQTDPETIVIISPHAYLEQYSFAINSAEQLVGNFVDFGPDLAYAYENDIEIADRLAFACSMNDLPAHLHQGFLDHGALIPLYHLTKNIKPKIVHLSFSLMNYDFHYRYGEILRSVIGDNSGKRVAIIASGDLSHRLIPNASAGFSPKAKEFDSMILHYLGANDVASIMNMDEQITAEAAECGMRSIMILLGALSGKPYEFKLLSYEGPSGVGYLTARLV